MRFIACFSVVIVCSPAIAQQPEPKFAHPHGYTRETTNKKFTFVMLAPPNADLSKLPYSYQARTEELAKKYPASGLYKTGELTPVWKYTGPFAYEVYPANDGIHLAVVEGESWFTSQFVSGTKLPADVEKSQLDSPAVTFYQQGTPICSHTVREIVLDTERLRHSPQHVQWRAGEAIVERSNRFLMYTQDAQKIFFDMETGKLLSKEPAGGNAKYYLAAIGAVTCVAVFLAIVWLVRTPKTVVNPP